MSSHRSVVARLVAVALVAAGAVVVPGGAPVDASVSGVTLTGGSGTVSVGGSLYAKQGGALTLAVTTSADTKCVDASGVYTDYLTSAAGKTNWSFPTFTAGAGDGTQTITVQSFTNFNSSKCTGNSTGSQTVSFVLDNTGPVVTAAVAPTPNGAGWNNGNVSITWAATDAGSGVASGPTPATDSVTSNSAGVTKTATAVDRLGNTASGSVTVKLDKSAPTIAGSASPAPNANGWNNTDVTVTFTCGDTLSGVKSCSGPTTLTSSAANQSVTGTAVDNADNSSTATVSNIGIDKVAPTLTGAPTAGPNAAGWYNADVTVHWTCADSLSGIVGSCPADSTISGEGTALTANASVADKAGNSTSASSSPAVKIDKTAPTTTATAPTNWNNTDVTVALNASDALSGVKATHYRLDGGADQTGTTVAVSAEGVHTLQFWSVDNAGNTEATKSVQVKIDKTPPTINHSQSPAANADGWNNGDVTVTFTCTDSGSGVASCTPAQTVSTEGANQPVTGTATDNAGNTATDPAHVNIDKTKPTITAAPDRTPNAAGWYNNPVTVTYSCGDALSGIASCSAPTTLAGDGAGQSATGTATDAAGNTETATTGGINIDAAAPTLSGAATTDPNGAGWYSGDVTVHWTAGDALSGLAAVPGDSVITGEGADQCAAVTVSDKAGNATTKTVCVNIDRTPPSTTITLPEPFASGWYGSSVAVTLHAVDGLSQVGSTRYAVDGGAPVAYTGPFDFTTGGVHTITFWSTDNAGNVEDRNAAGHTVTVKLDDIAPTITGARTPAANAAGWNNSDVTVTFQCADGETGIDHCADPVTVTTDGADQAVNGSAVDRAGNNASATVAGISIDKTPPTISGAVDPAPNGNGWNNTDVKVTFSCTDGLSGVASCTDPAVLTNDTSNGTATGSATDRAGNTASTTVSGIMIDKTPPGLVGAPTTLPNAAGWYHTPVTIHWEASDQGSGIDTASLPGDSTIGEGADAIASASVSDKAGNSTSASSAPVNVDLTAPVTTATAPGGWTSADVTVDLHASDNLSGVDTTYVSADGAAPKAAASATFTTDGDHVLEFWSVDKAGNTEAHQSLHVFVDKTAPTIAHTVDPAPNAAGWSNADTTVSFRCDDATSGVASCSAPTTVASEGEGQAVIGRAVDTAGNDAVDNVVVNLDKTPPAVTVSADRPANADGWYNADVAVSFNCRDDLSGVADCPTGRAVGEGADQSVSGTAHDVAGNSADAALTGINVDKTAPTITGAPTSSPNDQGWYHGPVTVHFTCADALSGVASCPADVTLTEGANQAVTATVFDKAGNAATATVDHIDVDTTAPTIVAGRTPAANGNGWNNSPVTVSFTCSDALSGIAGCTPEHTLAADGAGQQVSGTATDVAGNTASVDVTGVNIDTEPPSISGAPTTDPNGAGWYNGDVTVKWTCADKLSGVAHCPGDSVITGEGSGLQAVGNATDKADNTASAAAPAVDIDRTPPATTAVAPGGWTNDSVTLALSATDNLSGVAATHFRLDGGADQTGNSVTVTAEGDHAVTFWSVDIAGNAESPTTAHVKIDKTAPSIGHTQSPEANGAGWNNTDVTVTFTCGDQAGLSGVRSCTGPQKVSAEGASMAVVGTAVDNAGNTATDTDTLNIDKTAPSITPSADRSPNGSGWYNAEVTVSFSCGDSLSGVADCAAPVTLHEGAGQSASGSVHDRAGNAANATSTGFNIDETAPTIKGAVTTSANAGGWYRGPVTVHFTCADALSGVADCPADAVLTSDGADQTVTGTAHDRAGNAASVVIGGINIDTHGPALTVNGVTEGGVYLLGTAPTPGCSATDALSDVAGPCTGTLTGGNANGVGTFTYTATATDKAGNTSTLVVHYKVIYRFDGFLQPINDTAHQTGTATSIFKAGSTVPAKIQVKRADGTIVQTVTAPVWLTPLKGNAATAPVDETAYTDSTTSGSAYRWDATGQQYIFNWGTSKTQVGYYWRVGVTLDDGQTYYVSIGLR